MRVVSLLPSATELLCAAGGADLLVGRSHECDWPTSIHDRPVLTGQRVTATTSAARFVAELRGVDRVEFERQLDANAERFFGVKLPEL